MSGYGCEDHFLEQDTFAHSWECLAAILESNATADIIVDVGMPVMHKSVRYNCRVICFNRKILLIRPKMFLADDGNYRESRWFTAWTHHRHVEKFHVPQNIVAITAEASVPFGDALIRTNDTSIAPESCEELFTANSPHIYLGLDGVEIFVNGSGSHHELRKLNRRVDLIRDATSKVGGVYLYANQMGCDGGRLLFDGCALIACNGQVLKQGGQFFIHDVEVVTATVDLDAVRSYRSAIASRGIQASRADAVPEVFVPVTLSALPEVQSDICPTPPCVVRYHSPLEEIAYGPAIWLWDYLRRSGASGFFLPLSGGADSSAVATIVGSMCQLVVESVRAGNTGVLRDARRLLGIDSSSSWIPTDHRALCNSLLHTCYMGTVNSSDRTRDLAKSLATQLGAYHLDIKIDAVVSAAVALFTAVTGVAPRFAVHGGRREENLALQNIQARLRMVIGYLFAQLLPLVRGRQGYLLVLSSANVDEGLRGYMTKYDCSSGDLNPIASINKEDLRDFLLWAAKDNTLGYSILQNIATAPPTAELVPRDAGYEQTDEVEMGMTYAELGIFGRLRKISLCGPVDMFRKLC